MDDDLVASRQSPMDLGWILPPEPNIILCILDLSLTDIQVEYSPVQHGSR
jgi:hypothetical protein